jgi:hypothetical protein
MEGENDIFHVKRKKNCAASKVSSRSSNIQTPNIEYLDLKCFYYEVGSCKAIYV